MFNALLDKEEDEVLNVSLAFLLHMFILKRTSDHEQSSSSHNQTIENDESAKNNR